MTRRLSVKAKVSTLALAIALAAGPTPAAAQFVGNIDGSTGIDTVNSTNSNLIITGQQAVINWTATDTPTNGVIAFLPEGNSVTFSSGSDFAVLNRVTPGTAGNAIFMGGSISSFAGDFVGGTVFFYSPNGIVIGQNASINVGALGLTTLPITDNNGVWMSGFGTSNPQVTFGQATDPNSFIRIVPMIDGSINAHGVASLNGPSSYVALVAPRIEHSGVIRTDVAAALVAAEAATITFSPDGLFDIQVDVGTDDPDGIDVNGGTIERRSQTEGVNSHYAYLVAVAKNDAVTMLIRNGGSIGFDTATSAAVEDNVVVLSGGRDIEDSQIGGASGAAPVNLTIDGASFSTDVIADISGGADINSDSGSTSFGLDSTSTSLDLTAGANSRIAATNGNSLSIAGGLLADLDVEGSGPTATGNLFRLTTVGASELTVGGNVTITAQTFGAGGADQNGGDATGGTAIVQTSSGGTIAIGGNLDINVDGWGGSVTGFELAGGNGTGGTAHILANGGSGSNLTVSGNVNVSASGHGGVIGDDCFSCRITGGSGTGGTIMLEARVGTGNVLLLDGSSVTLSATGEGGGGDAAGGNGQGGIIQLNAGDGGSLTIDGNLLADATANGGAGVDNEEIGGQGGSATGGAISTNFSGAASSITLNGTSTLAANAFGGNGVLGGNGQGGSVNLQVNNNGTLTTGFLGGSANGSGGDGFTGGAGTGGNAWVQATTGGDVVANALSLSANGLGGSGEETRAGDTGAVGGLGTGGHVIASANGVGSTLTVTNTLDLEALGTGGFDFTGTSLGGNGQGGEAEIIAASSGVVTLNGFVSADTTGRGGGYFSDESTGGNGTGGTTVLRSNGGTLHAVGEVQLTADGIGGFGFGDCNFCGGTGGDGTGGTVNIETFGGAAATMTLDSELNATAIGFGSSGFAGAGGDGQGGTVRMLVRDGATTNLLGNLFLNASGQGGWQTNGGFAGSGAGGLVDVFIGVSGGTLNVDGFAEFSANGFGGTTEGSDGTAGDGLGGTARYIGLGGTANFDSDLIVQAEGHGGSAGTEGLSGTGGDGTGNSARISAVGGDVNIAGTASVSTNGFGGAGTTGGSGTGGGNFFTNTGGAHLFAQSGDMVIGGAAIAMADGFGADGTDGGNGGNGTGGWASIHAANGDAGPSSITVQGVEASAFVSANGVGGNGGDGLGGIDGEGSGSNGGDGTDGGNGGIGSGGVAAITAAAGNGTLNINLGFVDATGTGGSGGIGGTGGAGGNGDGTPGGNGGDGGNGGAGGAAFGGLASIGVEGGTAQAVGSNAGAANFTFMEVNASATGGNGGAGGTGGSGGSGTPAGLAGSDGLGGNGGDADGGTAELQARGGTVDLFSALLTANATGGDGGVSPTGPDGAGGNAESDEAVVVVTNRPGNTSLRGTLNAGTINATVLSSGGLGSTSGAGMMEGGSGFVVINGDATIDSVAFDIVAGGQIPDLATDSISIINADVDIANGFTFNTSGVASIRADNATLNAASFTVSATNFVHEPDRPFPASVGTISANMFDLATQGDLIIDAHLISTGSLDLIAPGLIDIEDATSGGDLLLQAGSTIDGRTQTAAGSVTANAFGNITLGNVNAGSFIDILSSDGDLSLEFLSAGTSIDLEAGGDIGFADLTADDFDFEAGGDVSGGDIIAGTQASGEAGGAVTLGAINVGILQTGGAPEDGFAVGISSATSISVGNVDADEAIGFATLGNLTTGALNAGTDVMTLVGGDTSIASITTPGGGRVYHGDAQMFLDAGGPDDFDPALVFAQDPVRSGGSYTVAGAISTGTLQVGAASISTGNIIASGDTALDAAGSVTTGNIDAGALAITAGANIGAGDIFAFDGVTLDAGGSILTGDIAAGFIDLLAVGNIGTGDLTTQILLGDKPGKQFLFPGASITLEAGGNISTGDISSIDGVYLQAGGSILTGGIFAFDFVEAHAGTSLTTDEIEAGDYILLTADTGAISIGEANAANAFQAVAGTNLTAGAVSASDINASAGGTATIAGAWSAGDVEVTSSDIDIGANGSISGGDILLVSTNATQTVVGDGVAGGGYQLSDAEYDRLHSNDITVLADSGLGAAPLMLIGDLSVDGSDGETIHDYEFVTGDSESGTAEGSIRILGNAVFSNMGTEQAVSFTTGTFELDAATGLLSLESGPGVLGGQLFLNAARIHVASGDILDQLAEDPQYEGYQDDLNAPAAVQRPDGVVRAGSIEIEFGDAGEGQLNTLYVQNTGTEDVPAGFVISSESLFGEGNEVTPPPGSIDLVINGQIVTEGGALTGIDVRDALVAAEGDITPFTANSTINGCLLTGACDGGGEGPFPPGFIPTPGIQDEVTLIDDGLFPPPPFGNEDLIDDDEENEDGETSPIVPPDPLFDTSELGDAGATGKEVGTPMRSSPGLSKAGDIDDPVSGSGNPGLMETPPPPPSNKEKQP